MNDPTHPYLREAKLKALQVESLQTILDATPRRHFIRRARLNADIMEALYYQQLWEDAYYVVTHP